MGFTGAHVLYTFDAFILALYLLFHGCALLKYTCKQCYATSNNLIIFRPKLVLVFDFFFWLCKYFESDLAKVIQSQTICQPAITTFPLGLYWKTYLYLFLSKKIAPKWKVIQVSKISLLSKVRDEGGGVFQNDKELFPIIVWILYLYGEKKNWKGSCTEDPARIPRVVDVYVAGSKASESLESQILNTSLRSKYT